MSGSLVRAYWRASTLLKARGEDRLPSAMVETFLASVGAQWREEPIETALRSHAEWYRGDGAYGDGPEFHWDYYNSYVIQPFLLDVV